MIHLLYTLIFSQALIIVVLLFKSPLRKLVIITLDRLKRGKGPIMVKTVGGTVVALFASNVINMRKVGERVDDTGMVNPTDQVLLAKTLLEATLMGFLLFLALMIDRLHHYIRELGNLRKTMEAAKKQNRSFGDGKSGNVGELKNMGDEITDLKTKIKNLESEHGRLVEENQNLRNQLQ